MKSRFYILNLILFSIILLLPNLPIANAAENESDPLQSLLSYAKDVTEDLKTGTSGVMSPKKYLEHPYASKALINRLMEIVQKSSGKTVDQGSILLTEIEDAKKVEAVLNTEGKGADRVRSLAEIHPYTIFSREELSVLSLILDEMVRAHRPISEVSRIIRLIEEMQPFFQMNPNIPEINPETFQIERLCILARHGNKDPKLMKEAQKLLKSQPFSSDINYGLACFLSLTGKLSTAKSLLARLSLFDSNLLPKVKSDKDLAAIRQDTDWYEKFKQGKLKPHIKPGPNPGVDSIDIAYHWGGLGKRVDEKFRLQWTKDHYLEKEKNIEIPAGLIKLLIDEMQDSRATDTLQSRITHTDDFPTLKVTMNHLDGKKTIMFSSSNGPGMLPFNIIGKEGLRATNSMKFGRTLNYLLNWLEIKRGIPRGSYHSGGGNEIPRGRINGHMSEQEKKFRKIAGLPEEPPTVKEEPIPVELTDSSLTVKHLMGSYVPDSLGKPVVNVDRFLISYSKNKPSYKIMMVRVVKGSETFWYPEAPKEFIKHSKEVVERLNNALGGRLTECLIRPQIRSIEPSGLPGFDVRAFYFLERLNLEYEVLGSNSILLKIIAESPSIRFDGNILVGVRQVCCSDLEFKKHPFDGLLVKKIINWAGLNSDDTKFIKEITLRNNMIYVDLLGSATDEQKEKMKQEIAKAGRKLEVVGANIVKDRWLIKPTNKEYLHFVLLPNGEFEFRTKLTTMTK